MIRIFGLGASRIETGTMRLTPAAAKRFGLLLYLAAERGKHVPRSTIRELFFAGLEERNANHGLRELVYQLKRARVPIHSDDAGLMVAAEDVRCDWLEATPDGRIRTDTLEGILNGFLPGYAPEYSEAYTEWLDGFRATATFGIVKACLREIDSSRSAGDWAKTELAARACLALDPMNGHATIALAEMLAIGGSATQAAELLDAYAADLGPAARKLAMPVAVLRQQIAEAQLVGYDRPRDFEFAGRGDEMRLLSAALDGVRGGGSRAVLLTGEAGIGKSRIATEFGLRATVEGLAVVRTNAHPHDRHRPMGAFVDLVPLLLKERGALGCSPESMEWLKRLLGRKTSQPEGAAGFSNDETAHAIARSVFDLIESVAGEAPLLMIIDDAHWVDDVSLQLLRDIMVGQHPSGVLLVLTAREEGPVLGQGPWGQHFVSRRVEPLDRAVSEAMIARQLSLAGEEDASLSAWMADIASGNPFYADSLVTHFRASGERFAIPRQLSAIVDQRLAAVSADARTVLEAIVALGKHATIPRIELVLEEFGAALIRHVRELGVARLIVGDLRLAASHWLIVESVQRNAIAGAQRLLYRRIASVLERELSVEGDSSELWECAQAWSAAGEPDRAASTLATCAEHALGIGRAREAADLYYRAAEMSPDRVEDLAKASVRAAVSGLDAPAVLRSVSLLRRATKGPVHDEFELAEVRARLWADCSIEENLDSLCECIQSKDASVIHRLIAIRVFLAGCEYGPLVHRAVAMRHAIERLLFDTAPTTDPLIRLPSSILFHSTFGDVTALSADCRRLVAIANSATPSHRYVGFLQTAALGFHKAGRQEVALEIWKQTLALCAEAGLQFATRNLLMALAGQYLDAGDIDAAREYFDQVAEPDRMSEPSSVMYSYYATSAEFAVQLNDLDALRRLSNTASYLSSHGVSARIQRYRNLFECLQQHLDGAGRPVPEIIRVLTSFQVSGFEDGEIGDFETAMLLMILRDRGCGSLAGERLAEYLRTVRRPILQVTATLRHVADTLHRSES